MRDTDKDWAKIAETDPYWGVLSVEDYRGQDIDPAVRERFFASGRQFVDNLVAFIRKHISPQFAPKRSLDFGCGVGRLLLPMAHHSVEAIGLDVAPRMRELAIANAAQMGLTNVSVRESDDMLSAVDGPFDFVNTHIVMQHIPPSRGLLIIDRLLSKLAIGGVASIQITYAKSREFFMHEAGRAKYYRRDGDALIDIMPHATHRPDGEVTMFDYDLNAVFALASQYSGSPMLTLPTDEAGHLSVQLVFQRAR